MSSDNTLSGTPTPEAHEEAASPVASPIPTDGSRPVDEDATESVESVLPPSDGDAPGLHASTECDFSASGNFKSGVADILNELLHVSETLSLLGGCSAGLERHLRKEATRYAYNRLCRLHEEEAAAHYNKEKDK